MRVTNRPNSVGAADLAAFRMATGLIALHVVVDNFLRPEPGTSAADHLVSGLIACLSVVAAVGYPRLRPGLRAILCTGMGLFGITAGGEGWYYATQVGPSRDDYTGIIASVAGLALLVIAGVTLWRSRRLDDPLWRRYGRRGLTTVITLVVLLEVAYPLAVAYGGTHLARPAPPVAELGLPHEEVDILTSDGVTIKGWYVPSRNRAAVITYPARHSAQRHAQFLARQGYGVLLVDRRGQGGSEGDPNSYGWDEHQDIAAAIGFLRERPEIDPDRIGGIGFSVGGEVLLETAASASGVAGCRF